MKAVSDSLRLDVALCVLSVLTVALVLAVVFYLLGKPLSAGVLGTAIGGSAGYNVAELLLESSRRKPSSKRFIALFAALFCALLGYGLSGFVD